MPFCAPRTGGDICKPKDIIGHLLVVKPLEFVEKIQTEMGPSDAIRVDVADLDAQGGPVIFRDALWFNTLLLGLRRQLGELVLGRMSQGTARGSQSPPFMLVDATADPGATSRATLWLAANPAFDPSYRPPSEVPPTPTTITYQALGDNGQATTHTTTAVLPTSPPPVVTPETVTTKTLLDTLPPEQRAALEALGFRP